MNKKILGILLLIIGTLTLPAYGQKAQLGEKSEREINYFFLVYNPKGETNTFRHRMVSNKVNTSTKKITIFVDDRFAEQEFTKKSVKSIYKKVKKLLPKPYNKYELEINTSGIAIEKLVPGYESEDVTNLWGKLNYKGKPWVRNVSQPHQISHGLANRHISLWASHGIYYDQNKMIWKWQRPNLFGTTEDLFTPTIVIPYLIPMLEKAGAVVFTPRERDLQTQEIIVDNDDVPNQYYKENNQDKQWVTTPVRGFAQHAGWYVDGENPFMQGTARMTLANKGKGTVSEISYQPDIPSEGKYAVYVSYQTVDGSIEDAEYTVHHKGQSTVFHVNQRMGGSTWVYLGTFDFDKGCNIYNRVVLSNRSAKKGIVTADAVRFGGGMGNIRRGMSVSGMPRALEGARYSAQWAGAPYSIYGGRNGQDDYADDINVRSLMTNWLAGGSVYVPSKEGKNVPIELSLGIHSDAGYASNGMDLIGSLSICTTNHNDGKLNSGVSRMMSHDFANTLLKGVERDIHQSYGKWNIRELYDRNYSETRLPEIPSAILETMSHQNFPDMMYGQDPNFKFTLARSIYKSILRFVNTQHGQPHIVAPLAPINFRIKFIDKNRVRLQWDKQKDMSEPTANPTAYNVYTAVGSSGFDNGETVKNNYIDMQLEPGIQYNFRVTAVNRGGESFPSETLSAVYQPAAKGTILIVNGFNRLASPAVINTTTQQGFDLAADPGVSYGSQAGWIGKQIFFDTTTMGKEGYGGLGYGGNELQGQVIAGNDFNYVRTHAEAIASGKQYSIVSASSKAVENGLVDISHYQAVDLILGLEKNDGHSLVYYKTFSSSMQDKLNTYLKKNGRLIVSGAYVASDMQNPEEQAFLANTLKVQFVTSRNNGTIQAAGQDIELYNSLNPVHYAAISTDVLQPVGAAYGAFAYSDGSISSVVYEGLDYKTFTLGFPFECIKDKQQRAIVMSGILHTIMK